MKSMKWAVGLAAFAAACTGAGATAPANEAADRAALAKMSSYIRQAFATGDVAAIMACHDDAVEKSFPLTARLVGKDAVADNLRATFAGNQVNFVSNDVESLLIRGDVAVEQTSFAVEGTPKAGGEKWTFRGRAQVVYVRNPNSPCGWSTIRELVQPAG